MACDPSPELNWISASFNISWAFQITSTGALTSIGPGASSSLATSKRVELKVMCLPMIRYFLITPNIQKPRSDRAGTFKELFLGRFFGCRLRCRL